MITLGFFLWTSKACNSGVTKYNTLFVLKHFILKRVLNVYEHRYKWQADFFFFRKLARKLQKSYMHWILQDRILLLCRALKDSLLNLMGSITRFQQNSHPNYSQKNTQDFKLAHTGISHSGYMKRQMHFSYFSSVFLEEKVNSGAYL